MEATPGKIPFYESLVLPRQKLYIIKGDSHAQSTLERITHIIRGNKIDFLFIDGDHTYEGLKRDFEMYSPLIGKCGIIGFHDIKLYDPLAGCEVKKFWDEIKKEYKYLEIIEKESPWGGIGLIYL